MDFEGMNDVVETACVTREYDGEQQYDYIFAGEGAHAQMYFLNLQEKSFKMHRQIRNNSFWNNPGTGKSVCGYYWFFFTNIQDVEYLVPGNATFEDGIWKEWYQNAYVSILHLKKTWPVQIYQSLDLVDPDTESVYKIRVIQYNFYAMLNMERYGYLTVDKKVSAMTTAEPWGRHERMALPLDYLICSYEDMA